jgi:hypothetical protein
MKATAAALVLATLVVPFAANAAVIKTPTSPMPRINMPVKSLPTLGASAAFKKNQTFTMRNNIMITKHDTAKNSISNIH